MTRQTKNYWVSLLACGLAVGAFVMAAKTRVTYEVKPVDYWSSQSGLRNSKLERAHTELGSQVFAPVTIQTFVPGPMPSRQEVFEKLSNVRLTPSEQHQVLAFPRHPLAPRLIENVFLASRHLPPSELSVALGRLYLDLRQLGPWAGNALLGAAKSIPDGEFYHEKLLFLALSEHFPPDNPR